MLHDLYRMIDGDDVLFFVRPVGEHGPELQQLHSCYDGDPNPEVLMSSVWLVFKAASGREPNVLDFDMSAVYDAGVEGDEFDPWTVLQDKFGMEPAHRADVLIAFESGGLDAVIDLARVWESE